MAIHRVDAYPETCDVHTYQHGKTVWIATGMYRGEPLQEKGRSEKSALAKWKEHAEWRYRAS
jgi:hypothetical protein